MFYLYKKTHNKTGLKYLGYTKKDPQKYLGSGVWWTRHLKEYGTDVTTEVLLVCGSKQEIKEKGRYYSELWNVVESDQWANLKIEEADGGDMSMSKTWMAGRKSPRLKKIWSEKSKGNTNVRGYKWWYNHFTGEKRRAVHPPSSDWTNQCPVALTESGRKKIQMANSKPKTAEHIEKLKIAARNRPSNAKGTIWVKDANGKRKRVLPDNIPKGYNKV
jgi:hypothetical protein